MNSTFPIVNAADIPHDKGSPSASCDDDSLDPTKAFGKIIVCQEPYGETDGYLAGLGAVGLVSVNTDDQSVQFLPILPTAYVNGNTSDGDKIYKFLNSTR